MLKTFLLLCQITATIIGNLNVTGLFRVVFLMFDSFFFSLNLAIKFLIRAKTRLKIKFDFIGEKNCSSKSVEILILRKIPIKMG